LKRFRHEILRKKKCGNHLYCCPKSGIFLVYQSLKTMYLFQNLPAVPKHNEVCTPLHKCPLHLRPTKDNVQKLIRRHCANDPHERFSGRRISIFCPVQHCLPEERCLSRDKCLPLKYIIKSTEGRHASNKVLGERICDINRYCCPYLRNDSLNQNLFEFPNCESDESCIPIGKCPNMLDIVNATNATYQVKQEIYKIRLCTLDYRRKKLEHRVYTCCPQPGNFLPKDSNQQCGQVSNPGSFRISHGSESDLNQFPWMAMLLYENWDRTLAPKCGGSLINNWYVLTAAHCITDVHDSTLKRVRLGEHDTRTTKDCQQIYHLQMKCAPPHLEIDVKEVILHQNFSVGRIYANDIALVRLEIPVR